MVCPSCKQEGYMSDKTKFKELSCESSTSNLDDFDQIVELECLGCGYKFTHED